MSLLQDEVLFHIPVFAPKIKNPIILLEKCDNIWKTLQLIKTVQPEQITSNEDYSKEEEKKEKHNKENEEEEEELEKGEGMEGEEGEEEVEEEKKEHLNETLQSVYYANRRFTKRERNKNTGLLPFKFSVQSTRKVYPCLTCGKQYMERRSLRKHVWKIHGIFLPLIRKRVRTSANSTSSKSTDKKDLVSSDVLLKKGNSSESHHIDENPHGTITAAKAKVTKPSIMDTYVKCTLCKRKVSCLRKHLMSYHKIGANSSLMKQLESSVVENKVTPNKKTSLSNILSGKSPQTSSTQNIQDSFRIMDNEDTEEIFSVTKKRRRTLSRENKKLKIDESPARNENKRRTPSINVTSYKCSICFGIYASQHGLYKHKRIHKIRGETKENFHRFKCRYLNSPLNKRYNSLQSSAKSTVITGNNSGSIKRSVQPNNSKENQLFREKTFNPKRNVVNIKSGRNKTKDSRTICSCGRSFRNPHTLFIHKEQCNFDAQENKRTQTIRKRSYDDKDLGNGINIKIKKRNDSYEIVNKDIDDKSDKTIQIENSISVASSKSSDHTTKDDISTKSEVDTIKPPEYSKDHSIMKLEIVDEDLVVDIEDDVAVNTNKTDTRKQVTAPECDEGYLLQQDRKSDEKNTNTTVPDKMLKEMHDDVCEVLAERQVKNTLEDETVLKNNVQENSQTKEQKSSPVKNQEIHQENKMELRSCKRSRSVNFENFDDTFTRTYDREFDRPQLYMTKMGSSLKCGYCNEQFSTTNLYDNHQCVVKEGKPFDSFSLYLSCFYCSEVLNTYQDYDQHMKIKHLDDMYNCYQCPERFRHDKARLNHLQNYHDDMSCRICNKKMSTSTKILHESYHFGFGYPCHKCKKAYTSKKNLSYHKSTIHPAGGDSLITCSICLKSIKLKTFRGHMATHKHNECHFCGKMFSNRTGIEYHTMIYHGTHSKLKCNICGTRFINKNQLDKHEKMGACRNNGKKVKSRDVYYTNARNY